jgi:AraC-like DNA-binding protein
MTLCERRLQRVFAAQIGLSPSVWRRPQRLHATLRLMRNVEAPQWAQLALHAGYCDQSHLINDFRALCGLTPQQFLRRSPPPETGRSGYAQEAGTSTAMPSYLISYEALGLCDEGGAARFIDAGDNTYGGRVVTNQSGGLLSKGPPLGATGLAQCYELTHQLRGSAEQRQVPGARIALRHKLGLGGA